LSKKRNLRPINLLLFFIIFTGISWAYGLSYCTTSLIQNFVTVESKIDVEELTNSDIEAIGNLLPQIDRNLKIFRIFSLPLMPVAWISSHIPIIGPYAAQFMPTIQYISELTRAANLAYPYIYRLLAFATPDVRAEYFVQHAYWTIDEGQSSFIQASQAIENANLIRSEIDPALFPNTMERVFILLDDHFNSILHGIKILSLLPEVLGSPDNPQSYLLLAQNRDELRATGGFITGIGLAQISAGDLISLEIEDSYKVDDFSKNYPPPPDPLKEFMLAGYWVPRDANWSPDFPTSAQNVQELYTLSTNQPTDGVIAFDQEALKMLVSLIGPIELPDFPEAITAENMETLMQQARAPVIDQEWLEHRKDFMNPIGKAIIQQLMGIQDKALLMQLGREIISAIKSGHILIFSDHQPAQNALVQAGLDNGVHPEDGDFLLVVDSNIGFNKADAVIQRSITYLVDLSDTQTIPAMLITKYTHTVNHEVPCEYQSNPNNAIYVETQSRCYLDYWRVYKTNGTQVYSTNQTPIPGTWLLNGNDWEGDVRESIGEVNTQVISGLFMLPTAQSQEIVLQMLLPTHILQQTEDGRFYYQLRLQKQAGISDLPTVLQIKPPKNYQVDIPENDWEYNDQAGFWIWSGNLTNSSDIELYFSPSTLESP